MFVLFSKRNCNSAANSLYSLNIVVSSRAGVFGKSIMYEIVGYSIKQQPFTLFFIDDTGQDFGE